MSSNAQKVLAEGEELDADWAAEIERGVADELGAAKACSWEELETRLRARLTQGRVSPFAFVPKRKLKAKELLSIIGQRATRLPSGS